MSEKHDPLDALCPVCKAKPGQRCVTPLTGRAIRLVHRARKRAAPKRKLR